MFRVGGCCTATHKVDHVAISLGRLEIQSCGSRVHLLPESFHSFRHVVITPGAAAGSIRAYQALDKNDCLRGFVGTDSPEQWLNLYLRRFAQLTVMENGNARIVLAWKRRRARRYG